MTSLPSLSISSPTCLQKVVHIPVVTSKLDSTQPCNRNYRFPFLASEIFQTEINSLFDKFFEAPPEPEVQTQATVGENESSGDDQEYKSAVMLESEDEVK